MSECTLVVAAHPDDEVLGCGGLIARAADHGQEVRIAILAEGLTSRDTARDVAMRSDELQALHAVARQAGAALGAQSVEFGGCPDNRMDSLALLDITKMVEKLVQRYRPGTVLTHHRGDVNIDHRQIHDAVVTACRPQPGNPVRRLLFFEVNSSTEWQPPYSAAPFVPSVFVDISATLARKLEALSLYESEMRQWPHARSVKAVEHLARFRGATVGVEAAEAFVHGRELL